MDGYLFLLHVLDGKDIRSFKGRFLGIYGAINKFGPIKIISFLTLVEERPFPFSPFTHSLFLKT